MLNKEFYYLCLSGRKSCAEKKNPVSAILRDGIIEGCMFCLGLILFLNPRLSAVFISSEEVAVTLTYHLFYVLSFH